MSRVVLHPRDLAGCEHRLSLDHSHPDQARNRPDTPEAQRRKDAAADHRARVREMIRGLHSDQPTGTVVLVEPDTDHATRVAATLAACREGAAWIWNATLPTDREHGRRGHAELLIRDGDGYVPVIVVNHRVSYPAKPVRAPNGSLGNGSSTLTSPVWTWAPQPDPSRNGRNQRRDQLRLAQLTAMLRDLGLAASDDPQALRGGVIGLDADCIVVYEMAPLLDDYAEIFERRTAIAEQRVATTPRRIGECRSCPWWVRCGPELEERRDVSLVVGGNQSVVLDDAGITTIDQLAHYRGDPPADWPGNAPFDDAVLTAIAWLTDTPLIRRLEQPTVTRADVEVDVDMESYGEHGAYMWGTLLTDNTDPSRPVVYRAFVTWEPLPTRDEGRSFGEFWTWLSAEREAAREAGKSFAAYCYSQQAENRWLLGSAKRFAGIAGVPSLASVEAFIASDEWVDIYEAVGRNFVCPNGKGLKRVAPVAGFSWRDAEASGEASMDWYREAVGLGDTPMDLSQRRRLLEYNEDDVRATKVLREWIDGSAKHDVPHKDQVLEFRNPG
ncbi:TM0106 family RecB-like putative nuclease [Gordonia sp. OPL2]|uniref:TM0106 family RecB-like putative nuclease n=1 Tax=Gordonia sp. OPL2 TaxID=2486274 RepID=UPI0016566163|nr:TM0106 family RecB-like putative nuclease [Gordonia sp. OPL2]RPA12500.1 TM0106 family RecB-like putative nuclease [Gordonia sp. OPL2]